MPVLMTFRTVDKDYAEGRLVSITDIDADIRAHFVDKLTDTCEDPGQTFCRWGVMIPWGVSMGHTLEALENIFREDDPELSQIAAFLRAGGYTMYAKRVPHQDIGR